MHRRFFITSGLTGLSLSAALPSMVEAAADPQPPRPRNRDDATKIIAEARRIVTPDGVERLETVKIGGIDQWVSVRGKDRRNPVLLHIHGGPGYISIPISWWFSRDWEEYFTVVQWGVQSEHFRLPKTSITALQIIPEQHLQGAGDARSHSSTLWPRDMRPSTSFP